jgi:aldehyde:ferredoxin oxidoreductase
MNLYGVLQSACLCNFVFGGSWQLYGPEDLLNVMRSVTGWDLNMDEMMALGERRQIMLRAFNVREGFTRADDSLPKKMLKPLQGGRSDGIALTQAEFEGGLDEFYRLSGWDEQGTPTRERLEKLGVGWVAETMAA